MIWRGEQEGERRELTYLDLHREVSLFANALKARGVKRGTVVTIYLPMIPELPIALLACARLGAIHSVVFSAFSAEALASRIIDASAEVLITADISNHAGKVRQLKVHADKALEQCPTVTSVFVYRRGDDQVAMDEPRDLWWHEATANVAQECAAEKLDSESPLFILYTSGSTGKPKGFCIVMPVICSIHI